MIQKEGSIIGDIIGENQSRQEIFQEISDRSLGIEEGVNREEIIEIEKMRKEMETKKKEVSKRKKEVTIHV